jgi:hypothetical protein
MTSKRLLQAVVLVASLIPLTFGLLGIVFGAQQLQGSPVTASLDSQYRFLSAWYLGLAALAWWTVPRIEQHGTLLTIICLAIFAGGLARLVSAVLVGWPQPSMVGGLVFELLFPLLIPWQRRVAAPA